MKQSTFLALFLAILFVFSFQVVGFTEGEGTPTPQLPSTPGDSVTQSSTALGNFLESGDFGSFLESMEANADKQVDIFFNGGKPAPPNTRDAGIAVGQIPVSDPEPVVDIH